MNETNKQRADRLQTEVADEERWMREVLTDFRIPFDDHKQGRRYAMTCRMLALQALSLMNELEKGR